MKSELVSSNVQLTPMSQKIRPSDDRSFAIITLKNNKVPLKSAFGTFVMKVDDIINIRSVLEVRPSTGTTSMIYSETIPVFVPSFNVTHTSPEKIRMRKQTSFNADITLPLFGVNNAYAKLYMPYNDNEAKITIADFAVSGISGVGIGATDILNSRLNSGITKFSRSMTSEEDTATITFPTLNITDAANDVIMLTLLCQGILQNFMGYSDGQNMEMDIGFKLNEDFIWIGSTNVSIDDDTDAMDQRPILVTELTEIHRSIHHGTINCKMKLSIIHDDKSLGTAYNITVILYLPNTVSFVSSTRHVHYYDVVKRAHQFEEDQTVRFELPRISFPHSSRIIFNVTMDTKTALYLNSDNTGITYEVLYSGWRTDGVFSVSLQYFEMMIDNIKDENTDLITGMKCSCPGDNDDKTCACCSKNACQCGQQNPYNCVPCDSLDRCAETIKGYYQLSTLQDMNGTTYHCDDRTKLRPPRVFASCMARFSSGTEKVLSPLVSVLLGLDYDNTILYGLSNNGQGYVFSSDLGTSWMSCSRAVYISALYNENFLNATLN
ncbi:uncharacterized protein [Mytilus edulis]|uniref:uncharacterized protein n=1 Tax=Mytilus edulis TaxID=6550 RepID=UPI0039F089D1